MKKRGISPLVATVLLIGFTIVIGSMVMIWGSDIFEKIKSGSEEEAITQLTCTTKINLNIKEACDLGTSVRVKLENLGDQKIESLMYRAISPSGAAIDTLNEPLSPFEIQTFSFDYFAVDNFYTKPNKIELLPIILIDGKEKTCSGTSKEIKPCYVLPSLNDLNDWIFIPNEGKGLVKNNENLLNLLKSNYINDEVGVYVAGYRDLKIESKEFSIPPEANYFFIRILSQNKDTGDINIYDNVVDYGLYKLSNEGLEEKINSDSISVNGDSAVIGYKFNLIRLTELNNVYIKSIKTNGGGLGITNIGYIIQ